ncbi:hypothetical protein [Pseudoalteromonas luteoviolacea]|uniref:hypothetical protein n=1 Tax=Pseudoalteromonas luteoviolacea TaxID=43657 RepID=UPI001B397352|nr:hypothetical protein [Pseudoalteromonas luteoviolacea]MBQ4835513.1 hypothetical protein [Pseudoalteromonas luteoviolacea]
MLNEEIKIDTPRWFKALHLAVMCVFSIVIASFTYIGLYTGFELTLLIVAKAVFYSYLVFTVFMNIRCLKYYGVHFVIKNNKVYYHKNTAITEYELDELEFEEYALSGIYKIQTKNGDVLAIMHSWLPGGQILVSNLGRCID